MSNDCLAHVQACAVRAARLDGAGVPNPGADNLYVTDALITMTLTADVEEGDEFTQKSACGATCASFRDCDRLKRVNVELQICNPDPELHELLAGGAVLTNGDAVGYGYPRLNAADCPNGVSLEVFTKRITSGGSLDDVFPYGWWVLPKVFLQVGNRTFENGIQLSNFSGFAVENENWFDGPLNDWPVASDRVVQWIPTETLPETSCGFQSIQAS